VLQSAPGSPRPRVLLGNLEPMVRMGMAAVLGDDGVEIVGQEERPAALLLMAGHLRPDVVLLDLGRSDSRELGARLRLASPETTVILWARDEDAMEVFDPDSPTPRRFHREQLTEELRGELIACHARPSIPQVEE
jgi:DNA-binding NarL/FixJ family response regulator